MGAQAVLAPARPAAVETSAIWIQAATFASRADAEHAARRLSEHARLDVVITAEHQSYRVLIGPWPDANAAERARQAVVRAAMATPC